MLQCAGVVSLRNVTLIIIIIIHRKTKFFCVSSLKFHVKDKLKFLLLITERRQWCDDAILIEFNREVFFLESYVITMFFIVSTRILIEFSMVCGDEQ